MSFRSLVIVPVVGLMLAACTSGGSGGTALPSNPATGAPSGSPFTRIEVRLTDALKIEPATLRVPAGVPVTFVVTNAGATEHEFYIGDEAAQAKHEDEMKEMGGMMHADSDDISLKGGETKELTHTFTGPAKPSQAAMSWATTVPE